MVPLLWKKEDTNLIKLLDVEGIPVNHHAQKKWTTIADKLATGRTAKQCRDRWFNHLRAGITKGEWTPDEEDLIIDMYATFGGRYV